MIIKLLLTSFIGFAYSLKINTEDLREIEKYTQYCKDGQKPQTAMLGLRSYFIAKKNITADITCGYAQNGIDPSLIIESTKGSTKFQWFVSFRENSNKNSKIKHVVEKISEFEFKRDCSSGKCKVTNTQSKQIWPALTPKSADHSGAK